MKVQVDTPKSRKLIECTDVRPNSFDGSLHLYNTIEEVEYIERLVGMLNPRWMYEKCVTSKVQDVAVFPAGQWTSYEVLND